MIRIIAATAGFSYSGEAVRFSSARFFFFFASHSIVQRQGSQPQRKERASRFTMSHGCVAPFDVATHQSPLHAVVARDYVHA